MACNLKLHDGARFHCLFFSLAKKCILMHWSASFFSPCENYGLTNDNYPKIFHAAVHFSFSNMADEILLCEISFSAHTSRQGAGNFLKIYQFFKIFWNTVEFLEHFWMFWNTLKHFRTSGTLWNVKSYKTFWNTLEIGIFWNILEYEFWLLHPLHRGLNCTVRILTQTAQ